MHTQLFNSVLGCTVRYNRPFKGDHNDADVVKTSLKPLPQTETTVVQLRRVVLDMQPAN